MTIRPMKYVTHSAIVMPAKPCENSTPIDERACTGASFETKVSSPENRYPVTRPSVAAILLDAASRKASRRADSGRNRIKGEQARRLRQEQDKERNQRQAND